MRYRLRTLLIVVTIIGAFFAGRQSVIPLLKEQERQNALEREHNALLEGQVRSLEKSKPIRDAYAEYQKSLGRGGGGGGRVGGRLPQPVEAEPGVIFLAPATPSP